MSSPTQADAAILAKTAEKFDTVNDALMKMLTKLNNELEVLRSAWQGQGGVAFQDVQRRWAEDQTKIQRALAETAAAIRTSGQTYTATDTNAASRVAATNSGGITLPL